MARERGADDPEVLTHLARALAYVPGRREEVLELLHRAIELDPLNTGTHYRLGKFLEGDEAVKELRICTEIDPMHSGALGDLAWAIYIEQMKDLSKPRTEAEADLAKESLELVKRAVAIDPAHRHLDTLAVIEAKLGDFASAVVNAKRAVQMEPEGKAYLRTLAIAQAATGDVRGFLKTMRRLEMVLKRPAREGDAPPLEAVVWSRMRRALEEAVGVCLSWGKAQEAVTAQDRWFTLQPPGNDTQWYDWADAIDQSGDRKRAREVVEKGLADYPESKILKNLQKYLESEKK